MKPIIHNPEELYMGVWKYVITEEGSTLFTQIRSGLQHRELVPDGEKPIHAGSFIHLGHGEWMMGQPESETLRIYGDKARDVEVLSKVIGKRPIPDEPQ